MQHPPRPRFAITALAFVAALAVQGCSQESPQTLLTEARADLAKKDSASAIVRLKKVLQEDPESGAARVLLGEALLNSGDPGAAAVELGKALEQGASADEVMPTLARALLLSSQHRKLISSHADVKLKDAKADADFRTSLATAWMVNGNKPRAEETLKAVLSASPDFAQARLVQARFTVGRGEVQPALKLVEELLRDNPGLHEAWHLRGEIHAYGLGDMKAAEPFFAKALETNEAHFPSRVEIVRARIQAGDMAGAKTQLDRLRKQAPTHLSTVFLQSQMAYYDKEFAKAKELTQAILRVQPENVGALQMMSAVEWEAGNLVLAARPLETALKIDPELAEARTNLAFIYLRLGQPATAMDYLRPLLAGRSASSRALSAAAQASMQLNRLDEAEALYARAAEASPDDGQTRTALALTRLAKGEASQAFAQLETLATKSQEAFADAALISARMRRGELDAALAAAQALAKKAPSNPQGHEFLGRVHLMRDELPPAREAFEKALALDPRLLTATASLAEIDLRAGQPQAAIGRVEAVVKAEPGNYAAHMLLAEVRRLTGASAELVRESFANAVKAAPTQALPRLRLVTFLEGRRQFGAARTAAQDALAAVPNNVQLLDALGRIQVASGERQQAMSTFRSIKAVDPNNATAHVRMAELHRFGGDLGAAAAELRRALELDPSLRQARVAMVDTLVQQKRSAEALEMAKQLQQRSPRSSAGYLLEGAVQTRLKKQDAALAAYKQGLANAIDQGELALNYMGSLALAGKAAEAERFALDWLARNPGDAAMHASLGEYYLGLRQLKPAAEQFAKVVATQPDDASALNNLAWLLAQQRSPRAVDLARRALVLQPGNPTFLDTLSTALALQGKRAEALEAQKQAVELAPSDPVLRLRLVKLAKDTGDLALARSELEKVLAAPGDKAVADEANILKKQL